MAARLFRDGGSVKGKGRQENDYWLRRGRNRGDGGGVTEGEKRCPLATLQNPPYKKAKLPSLHSLTSHLGTRGRVKKSLNTTIEGPWKGALLKDYEKRGRGGKSSFASAISRGEHPVPRGGESQRKEGREGEKAPINRPVSSNKQKKSAGGRQTVWFNY